MKTFALTDEQEQKVTEWYDKIKTRLHITPFSYGAAGGGLTYSFIPTGLGTIIIVKEYLSGDELNLTEFEDW